MGQIADIMRSGWVLALVMLLWLSNSTFAQRLPYTPERLSLIRTISECRLAPDGKIVAFVTDITDAMELWTVAAEGGWPVQLTHLNENVSDIHWSPDSQWIVFASDYGGNERRDLYRVPAAGGQVEKLTDSSLSESEPRFSPDSQRLAFTADPDQDFHFQLHVLDVETRKIVRLTREAVTLQLPLWSPDGKTIAINRSGDNQKGKLLMVDASTGATVVVEPAVKDGILWPEAFSPDGQSLLLRARNPAGFVQLAVLKLAASQEVGKPPQPLGSPAFLGPDNWDVTEARWDRGGLYFLLNEGGKTGLYMLPTPQGRALPVDLPEGTARQLSLDDSGGQIALLYESTTQPADVWVIQRWPPPIKDSNLPLHYLYKPVTFSLLGGIKPEELSTGSMIVYESFDKRKIHALLVKPRVSQLGSPPPAVVYVHSGPNSQHTLSFDPYVHVLAEAGFAVIAPNYRGSTGYGKAFTDANNKDWGGGDLRDLIAAVQHFSARGDIDPQRIGITGSSYGGYLTLMALAKTPEVWSAGIELYGMPDLIIDYLLSKSRFVEWYETEMSNPTANATLFRERSPLPYLDGIKAPLLIFQGANDTNVPRAESDLLVAVLRELKKPHEYIVYGDEGHGFIRRKNLLDMYRRAMEFFIEHLKPKK